MSAVKNHGLIWTRDTSGDAVCFSPDAVLSMKPNTSVLGPDGGHPVTLVWLKGHRRHTALACSLSELARALDDHDRPDPTHIAWHVNMRKHPSFFRWCEEQRRKLTAESDCSCAAVHEGPCQDGRAA